MSTRISVGRRAGGILLGALLLAIASAISASAHTYTVLYSFCAQSGCTDGQAPNGGVVLDAAGNIFGVTAQGGNYQFTAAGTIYELVPDANKSNWTLSSLRSFCEYCVDGDTPIGSLVIGQSGSLYGVTQFGGPVVNSIENGGTAFQLVRKRRGNTWLFHQIHAFCPDDCPSDGRNPADGLTYAGAELGQTYDETVALYGTTAAGGSHEFDGGGTAYALTPRVGKKRWQEFVIHDFCARSGCSDGKAPRSALLPDATGNLYGVANGGKFNGGIAFELKPARKRSWHDSAIHNFCNVRCMDGTAPAGPLVSDANGNLFGTTQIGGKHCIGQGPCGSVFELEAEGSKHRLRILHAFCSEFNCRDGKLPMSGVVIDSIGNLYGTTSQGGGNDLDDPKGGGALFRIATDGKFEVLYRFCARSQCKDGDRPVGKLWLDASGNIYGAVSLGGAYGGGAVYEYSPSN